MPPSINVLVLSIILSIVSAIPHLRTEIHTHDVSGDTKQAVLETTHPVTLATLFRQTKKNFEPCQLSTECEGMRSCVTIADGAIVQCSAGAKCRCAPPTMAQARCREISQCDVGERCFKTVCLSNMVAGDDFDPISPSNNPPTNKPALHRRPRFANMNNGSGLTGDHCSRGSQCAAPRMCVHEDTGSPCKGWGCRCADLDARPCPKKEDCVTGEVCESASIVGFPMEERMCISKRAADEEGGCIASHHIVHLHQDELVYPKDRFARVLCDDNNNCATPGHIVQVKGSAMMMKSYCKIAGCTREVMRVNSPRYSRGRVVASLSNDLVFTSFAARYETLVEERILCAAVRIGL